MKSNIGHPEAAAGIAGLIKVALGLRHRQLPADLHFDMPNPQIDFAGLGLEVQTQLTEWPRRDGPARAGVSSFGFGGTNAHVILEEARASSPPQMEELLRELVAQGSGEGRQPVFFFAGHGSQWIGMGRELLMASPLFRASLQACDRQIQAQVGWSLLPELLAPPRAISAPRAGGGAARHLLRAGGPGRAVAVVGCRASNRSRAQPGRGGGGVRRRGAEPRGGVQIVCLRGQLTGRLVGHGGLLLLERSRQEVEEILRGHSGASIAVCNSPTSTVIVGEHPVLEIIASQQRAAGVRCTFVDAAFPSHSALMEPILPEFIEGLSGLSPQPTHTPLLSTMTGRFMEGRELDGHYWARNLREPVEFAAAIEMLAQSGEDLFLEVGPQPALARFVEQNLAHAGREGMVVTSTHRNGTEWETLLEAASALQACGVSVSPRASHEETLSPPHVLAVSAQSPQALRERVAGMLELLESQPSIRLDDLCYTAACWPQPPGAPRGSGEHLAHGPEGSARRGAGDAARGAGGAYPSSARGLRLRRPGRPVGGHGPRSAGARARLPSGAAGL